MGTITASISGHFYHDYPKVKVVASGTIEEMMSRYLNVRDMEQLFLQNEGDMEVVASQKTLRKSALIFIHGYNHSFKDAMRELGQLSALANFPQGMILACYSWPCHRVSFYHKSAKFSASDEVSNDLRVFISELAKQGIEEFHIITHSMGARVISAFVSSPHMSRTFREISNIELESFNLKDFNLKKPILATVTMCAPDAEVNGLRSFYDNTLPYCNHMTLYTDRRDQALALSQILHFGADSLGRFTQVVKGLKHLDIIDCSHLEHNTNWNYHNYFFMNLSIVGDIREIIVNKTRARHRSAYLIAKHPADNSFQFKSVPSGLVIKT
eukprot:TRINITY_DN1567_c3_g1_i4.p2 TRINITY_DN1567_c3_g1~~TRINITY_DN1567_c3_g1_i4.p2  ORF type:complete len:326 (+),score=93.37 TRINITY_DN1567_c3_g1_i4:1082-2059(+)